MAMPGDSTANGNPDLADFWAGTSEWSPEYNPRLALLNQCWVMIDHIARSGIQPPATALVTVDRARAEINGTATGDAVTPEELASAHGLLTKAIAPATPSTIQLLADERPGAFGRFLGPTTYARVLAAVAIGAFVLFVVGQGWLTYKSAPPWLDVAITALASIIGGLFYVMFDLSKQLKIGSFDRALEGHYTMLVILGGLAGTVLAFLIIQPGSTDATSVSVVLTRPLLALLGGFAAEAVYRILDRLAGTVEALVNGSGQELVAAQKRAVQARADAEVLASRTDTVRELLALNATLQGTNNDAARTEISRLITKLVSTQATP